MMRRADKPVYVNGTVVGHLCFTKFGICSILITGLTLSNRFQDEASAETALIEMTVQSECGQVIGFVSGPAPFTAELFDENQKANSWGGKLRNLGDFTSRKDAAAALKKEPA